MSVAVKQAKKKLNWEKYAIIISVLSLIITIILAAIILKEKVSLVVVVGGALMAIGAILVSLG